MAKSTKIGMRMDLRLEKRRRRRGGKEPQAKRERKGVGGYCLITPSSLACGLPCGTWEGVAVADRREVTGEVSRGGVAEVDEARYG